mgnify:CR=1 FL=1
MNHNYRVSSSTNIDGKHLSGRELTEHNYNWQKPEKQSIAEQKLQDKLEEPELRPVSKPDGLQPSTNRRKVFKPDTALDKAIQNDLHQRNIK